MNQKRAIRAIAGIAAVFIPLTGIALTSGIASAATAPACSSNVKSDFNGDGHADVAVAAMNNQDDQGKLGKSAVRVLYGTTGGLGTALSQYLDGTELGAGFTPADGDMFGASLVSGNFNGDCYADLAVGVVGQAPDTDATSGAVVVYYGSASGLSTANATVLTEAAIIATDPGSTLFASSLATGDFDKDGYGDLVVSAPMDETTGRGGIEVLKGSAAGVTATGRHYFSQATTGVIGTAEPFDLFGFAVAAGDFNGDGTSDIAVGAPSQTIGSASGAGTVTILLGQAGTGIVATGSQQWSQNSTSVPGTAESDDEFGWSLAAGDINKDGKADLVVGTPGEAIGTADGAGNITMLRGATGGLTGTSSQSWSQDSTGVAGTAEAEDQFGTAVSIGDLNGDGYGDVAVGVPGEAIGSKTGAGVVNVFYGRSTGLTATGSQTWDQDSTGISGTAENDDEFGTTVSILPLTSATHADLVVGNPGEDTGTFTDDGSLNIILGSKSTTGLTATGNTGFDATNLSPGRSSYAGLGITLGN